MEISCVYQGLATVTSLILLWISAHHCSVVDFELVLETDSYTEQEKACRDLGYDGLAILPTPEAFNLALRLTRPYRNDSGDSFYVGILMNYDTGERTWRDGTLLSPDTPQQTEDKGPEYLYGRMSVNGKIAFGPITWTKYALCGYDTSIVRIAYGQVSFNKKAAYTSSVLSEMSVSSHQQCAMVCARHHLCRAASFDLSSMTCSILGLDSSIDLEDSSTFNTFIRTSFETET